MLRQMNDLKYFIDNMRLVDIPMVTTRKLGSYDTKIVTVT